jgi:hypothetical protein
MGGSGVAYFKILSQLVAAVTLGIVGIILIGPHYCLIKQYFSLKLV